VLFIGKITLRQLTSILSYCKLYMGHDTGIMHITAAMKIPVLEISCWPEFGDKFSAKSPYHFGPWGVRHIILSPEKPLEPCKDECISSKPHCILQVTVEDAKEAVKKLLGSAINIMQ
jgi:ADP-heptose:LPS heptosyltransferase